MRELSPEEQFLEIIQEFRSQSTFYHYAAEEKKPEILAYINGLLDEYNDRILPVLELIES